MQHISNFRQHLMRVAGAAALAVLAVGCSDLSDSLLEAADPDIVDPTAAQSPEGAIGVYNGALSRFANLSAGDESTWLFGGLLADEWSTSSTFVQNDETDQRSIKLNNSSVTGMFRDLARIRTASNQAIELLTTWQPTMVAQVAEMHLARGFAELQLASDFCNGIPLSDGTGIEPVLGTPLSVAEVFQTAIASFDEAIATAGSTTGSLATSVGRAARIGKARAQLGLGDIAAAGATVAGIPTSFRYQHTFAQSSGSNTIWGQGISSERYSVGDNHEGNQGQFTVANALDFASANDPRLPVEYTHANGQDGQTHMRNTDLYDRETSIDVANGIDARLIEAEAALDAGQPGTMMTILNDLRATPPKLGEVQPAAMGPLADPGSAEARVDLLFREKAFWTFSRGQRLGDLRRLIRDYGRTEANTFPKGAHYKGGDYGPDVNLPVPEDEKNNPNFPGCTDRNA
ncbi:MAG TPA: hypothetical protein VFG84_06315 [Gemmatimonadaceae bacterium]|nr:hypothetical protein [Gemmatimonadaceae bacterium]